MIVRAAECTNCRLCLEVCPVGAVRPPGNGHVTYWIAPDRCTECVGHYSQPRCAVLCPAACVESDGSRLEDRATLIRKWHALARTDAFEAASPRAVSLEELGEPGD